MSTTLFEAPAYDPRRERRRRLLLIAGLVLLLVAAAMAYRFRNWPEERIVGHFFQALQQKQYETAYGIWFRDPGWKQHPERHAQYPFSEFYIDWGPGGEWGLIRTYRIVGSEHPRGGSGVVVLVEVNGRTELARVWVETKDRTMTFSPI